MKNATHLEGGGLWRFSAQSLLGTEPIEIQKFLENS